MTTTRWRKVGVTLALAALGAACSEATGPGPGRSDALLPAPREVTLRLGEEQPVGESVVRLYFAQVAEDSRCPADAVCVWEGNAEVELGIRLGMGPTHPLLLNTGLEPRSTLWSGLRVTLLEVAPEPRAGEPIRPDTYSVKVRVESEGR